MADEVVVPAPVVQKGPWYKSRTQWLGILAAIYSGLSLVPIPEAQAAQVLILSVGCIIGGSKARDLFKK